MTRSQGPFKGPMHVVLHTVATVVILTKVTFHRRINPYCLAYRQRDKLIQNDCDDSLRTVGQLLGPSSVSGSNSTNQRAEQALNLIPSHIEPSINKGLR